MAVESWDDDGDFQGEFQTFAGTSTGTVQTSLSSRLSVHSESLAGDEDWNVVLQPNDAQSTTQAIQSAEQAGIPLPSNVPTSALLGGTIKRLGKKKSRAKLDDDWDNDLVMADGPLTLKPKSLAPASLSLGDEMDDFDDLEGSLGIRFAGTRRDTRNRSSSASMMSPSLGSVTAESEMDDFGGLELPEAPIDFEAILKKRRATEAELSDLSQPSPAIKQPATMGSSTNVHKKSKLEADDHDDFGNDFDFDGGVALDIRKRTVNKNLQVKTNRPAAPAQRTATTLNFHDKPVEKPIYNRSHIPRPVSGSKQGSRLEPVFENGVHQTSREARHPTTTGSQLLRSKRSMPALRNQQSAPSLHKRASPFVATGSVNYPSSHANLQRAMPYHVRRESDSSHRQGAQSPPPRSHSRLSNQIAPETPSRTSRHRTDLAPATLAREAASKRTLTRPARKRNFGDGTELESFDDLPTSTTKESKFIKQPIARGPPKQGLLRHQASKSDVRADARRNIAIPDRMMTPAPPRTPASPTKGFPGGHSSTPSYLRDTAASRIAREAKNVNPRPRSEGPLQPLTTNWKAQIAARSPHTSPSAQRQKAKRPALIAGIGSHVAKSEKGMTYNPQTLRWEGNENTLANFDLLPPLETPTPSQHHPQTSCMDRRPTNPGPGPTISSSPSRPALIAQIPTQHTHNVQVQNGMVFDPQQMKWLKVRAGRALSGQLSPSDTLHDGDEDDDEDAFAGIADLRDENFSAIGGGGMASPVSMAAAGVGDVHEEFDLGPRFIALQREEEAAWRRRCEGWFPGGEAPRVDGGEWRYAIRAIVP